jgi:hypothetical protein
MPIKLSEFKAGGRRRYDLSIECVARLREKLAAEHVPWPGDWRAWNRAVSARVFTGPTIVRFVLWCWLHFDAGLEMERKGRLRKRFIDERSPHGPAADAVEIVGMLTEQEQERLDEFSLTFEVSRKSECHIDIQYPPSNAPPFSGHEQLVVGTVELPPNGAVAIFVRPRGTDSRYHPQRPPKMQPGTGRRAWALTAYFGNPEFSNPVETDHDVNSASIDFDISALALSCRKDLIQPLTEDQYKKLEGSSDVLGRSERGVTRQLRSVALGLRDSAGQLAPFFGPAVRLRPKGAVQLTGKDAWIEVRTRSEVTFSGLIREGEEVPAPEGSCSIKIKESENGAEAALFFLAVGPTLE